MKNIYLDKI